MRFRGTYLLVALAMGLLLFIYFYEIEGGPKRERAKEEAKKIVRVEEDKINFIEISRPGKEPIRLEKDEDGDWMLTSPLEARADKSSVGNLAGEIAEMKSNRSVGKVTSDLQVYGLATPEMKVGFKAGGEQKNILFGSDTPIGRETYVMIEGEDEIKVVSRYSADAFDKEAADLRDRRVVVFKEDELAGIELEAAGREEKIVLDRRDGDWWLSSPKKADASDSTVQGIIDQLRMLEAESFVPQPVAEASYKGKPDAAVKLIVGKRERASKRVDFYKVRGEDKALAHPEGEAWYYKVPATVLDDVAGPVEDFRERKLLRFDRFELTRMEVDGSGEGGPVVLKKDKSGDWKLEGADGKDVSYSRVYDFIDALEGLKARGFADDPPPVSVTGLDARPAVVLYGKSDEGEKEGEEKELARLILGKEKDGKLRYAKGGGEQVFLIDASFTVPSTVDYFTRKAPSSRPFTPEAGE